MSKFLDIVNCQFTIEALMESNMGMIRKNKNLKAGLKLSQTPNRVSEAICALNIRNGTLLKRWNPIVSVVPGGKLCDILVNDSKRVESKATFRDFSSFTETDRLSDVLIWVDYSKLLLHGIMTLPATCFYNPGKIVPPDKIKVTYDELLNLYKIHNGDIEVIYSIIFPGYTEYDANDRLQREIKESNHATSRFFGYEE